MTAHKHAALMLQYAEDAQTTDKPWELWEMSQLHLGRNWIGCEHNPNWADNIEYRRKPVKWQPVGGDWWVRSDGKVEEGYTDKEMKEFGLERPTREQAERAVVETRRFNRLLALRDELCGDDVVDWGSECKEKYTVSFNVESKGWLVFTGYVIKSTEPYFTTKESAQRACDMLNSGEVEL